MLSPSLPHPSISTSFHYGDVVVAVQIKPQHDIDGLHAPRRTVIDRLLVDAAQKAGAAIAFETQLVDLVRADTGRVSGVRFKDGMIGSGRSRLNS